MSQQIVLRELYSTLLEVKNFLLDTMPRMAESDILKSKELINKIDVTLANAEDEESIAKPIDEVITHPILKS